MTPEEVREARRNLNFSRELLKVGWYHSFELPDGSKIDGYMGLDHQRKRWARFPIPEDLTGKRVLDIGAWDGWFSFEAERRGAETVAIDCVEIPNFLKLHERLRSRVDYRILDFYELTSSGLGTFDIVFFLGVLYHLKHPFLALEMVCEMTGEVALVESFVTDGDTWSERAGEIPTMEFYETDELGEQLDNWNGPTVSCMLAMCRAAGFARVELLGAQGNNAAAACYRRWEPVPEDAAEAPELISARHSRNYGINFSRRKDEYLSCWFRAAREDLSRGDVRLDVDGFGVAALWVERETDGRWRANFRVPPGLKPGWREVRLGLAGTKFSEPQRIAVDMSVQAREVAIASVCGGITWTPGEMTAQDRPFLSCWIEGLGENCDCANIRGWIGKARLTVDWVGEPDQSGVRQANMIVPPDVASGVHELRVEFAGVSSPAIPLRISA
jgi:tRNA (mo5U34)-methyltransferase